MPAQAAETAAEPRKMRFSLTQSSPVTRAGRSLSGLFWCSTAVSFIVVFSSGPHVPLGALVPAHPAGDDRVLQPVQVLAGFRVVRRARDELPRPLVAPPAELAALHVAGPLAGPRGVWRVL